MLYTLSKAQYDDETLSVLNYVNGNDVVILWQDGVLQAVKNPQFFANFPRCYLLEKDVMARGLQPLLSEFHTISLSEFVKLSEVYYPQIEV